METRFRRFLLNRLALLIFILSAPHAHAETAEQGTAELEELQNIESVIQPKVERTKFNESVIRSQDIELIPTISIFSIEDFGSNIMLSAKIQYHATEDFFVGAEYG